MYKRMNPCYEYLVCGHLDMREYRYEQRDEKNHADQQAESHSHSGEDQGKTGRLRQGKNGIPEDRISDFVGFDPAPAIKFTISRLKPSGSAGETDIFGCR